MIRILFFIDALSGGGAEKVLQTLVNNMNQQKFEITVQTIEEVDPNGLLVPGIRYRAINRCKTNWGRKLFSYWLRLCAEFRWLYPLYIKDDYDIEVAYLECGPTKIMAGSTNQKALKLAWVHCDLEKKEGISAQAEKLKKYYQAYDKVICVSENVKDSFIRLFGAEPEAVVLHNVNDEADILTKAEAFGVPRAKGTNLVAVGRLTNQKGFDRLLEACSLLKRDGYVFRLRVLGEGPERPSLETQIQQNQLGDYVQLLGFQGNPYPYMKAADLLVCSSRYEGLSTVITEALILGKAVVTTPCTGMDELLGDSEYGLITEDSAEGIYTGLKKMLDEPELLKHYASAAKARGRDFSKNTILSQTEQFFTDSLEKKLSQH